MELVGCLIALVIIAVVLAIGPLCIMWVWNWIIPPMFEGAPEMGFWMAVAVSVVLLIVFGRKTITKVIKK